MALKEENRGWRLEARDWEMISASALRRGMERFSLGRVIGGEISLPGVHTAWLFTIAALPLNSLLRRQEHRHVTLAAIFRFELP